MVRETAPAVLDRGGARPRLLAVAGGKGGVGTTTIAVNLAVVLAQAGRRTVLADLSPAGRDAAFLCGLNRPPTPIHRPSGTSTLAERLDLGPGGVRVFTEGPAGETPWTSGENEDRLLEGFATLGTIAEFVVIDAGNSVGRATRRLWRTADAILVVATPELTSVMNAYAAIKSLVPPDGPPELFCVVSRAPEAAVAEDIYARLAQACRRFLGIRLRFAGYVPPAVEIEEAGRRGEPFVLASPNSVACRQILAVSRGIAGSEA